MIVEWLNGRALRVNGAMFVDLVDAISAAI
jgi:hypothetical protein